MVHLSSFLELRDLIEFNLLHPVTHVIDSHLTRINVQEHSIIRRLGRCICRIGKHFLAMEPDTASWALLDDQEAQVYNSIDRHTFSELSAAFENLAPSRLILFLRGLYRRGLVCIDDQWPIRPDIYDDQVPCHDCLLIELLVSERCNMGCVYCQADANEGKEDMSEDVAQATIHHAFALENERIIFEISGGEPLLNFTLVSKLVPLIEKRASAIGKDVDVNIVSNGTLITPHIAQFLADHHIKLTISLDGPKGVHELARPLAGGKSSWEMQQRCLDILKKVRVPFSVVLTVSSKNHRRAVEISRFLDRLNARSVKINPVFRVGRAADREDIAISSQAFLRFMKTIMECIVVEDLIVREFILSEMASRLMTRFRDYRCMRGNCNAGVSYFVIDPQGRIFPCAAMTEFPHTQLGHILSLDGRLDKLIYRNHFVSRLNARRIMETPCRDCEWRHFCQGGCIVEALRDPGVDLNRVRDPNCDFFRGMYTHFMELLDAFPDTLAKYLQSQSFGYGPAWVRDERFL